MSLQIRLARRRDIPLLMAVERSAAQLFRRLPEWRFIADGEVMSAQRHADFIERRSEWLAESREGAIAGFIAVQPQQADWHIAELSVADDWQRRGVGRQLIAAVADAAKRRGAHRLTLTTFAAVPWNAPYYRRLGFRPIEEPQLSPELRRHLAADAAHGFAADSRCAMEFTLS
ncbi:N-acetylglutamate synthase [Serratia ficaria]|uniref:GNAT family N-acetyltransferase n=1 Tax=Serratia TaxID=613 RepID=UPI001013C9BE|nr:MULTISPECIES: GNAT family N-acetyltransferase [Serratia]CAI1909681.1 N-acetylglutamate synthase [Serratia ficaria]